MWIYHDKKFGGEYDTPKDFKRTVEYGRVYDLVLTSNTFRTVDGGAAGSGNGAGSFGSRGSKGGAINKNGSVDWAFEDTSSYTRVYGAGRNGAAESETTVN